MSELERTAMNRTEEAMEPLFTKTEIKGVDINLLYETPLQSFEMDEIPELKQSIRLYGLLTPLTVCMDDDGKCEVLSGNRRYRAIKELRQEKVIKGYDEVPCMVLSGLSEAKKGLIVETTNIDVRKGYDETPHRFKIIEYLKQLVINGEEKDANIVKIAARYFKVSERYAAMYKAIFDSDNKAIREVTEKGQMSISDAARMTKLPQQTQEKIIEAVHKADNKKIAKAIVKECVEAEKKESNREKEGTADFKKEGTHQKQTKSEARNNIAQMSKENVDKMMENGYFGFGADSSLNEEMDNALDNIASHHEEILDNEMDIDFDYDEFSEFIEILLSLSPENIESDSKIADAISLCQQVVDRFADM